MPAIDPKLDIGMVSEVSLGPWSNSMDPKLNIGLMTVLIEPSRCYAWNGLDWTDIVTSRFVWNESEWQPVVGVEAKGGGH